MNDFRDRLLASGRSEMITRKILGVLRLVLNHAMNNGRVHSNAAQGVRVLRSSRLDYKVSVPPKQDVKSLIDDATGRFRAMLVVSALCGSRASETHGLRWADVDFADGFLNVRQHADFCGTLGEPKSAAGHRSVPAGPFVLNTLKEWKLACPKGDLDLVFPSSDGSVADHANTVRRHFKPLCDKLKIKLRWHGMRYFAASLWIAGVLDQGGHDLRGARLGADDHGALRHLFPTPDHQHGMVQVEQRVFG